MVRLLETTFIRVGNEEYARSNKSFGLTTLKDRHVQIGRTKLRFHFRGKSGVEHEISVDDPHAWRASSDAAGTCPARSCSSTSTTTGDPATIDSADVNDYIREVAGDDFTAKDFRTWAGTVLAATALAKLGASGGPATEAVLFVGPTATSRARFQLSPSVWATRRRSAESATSIPRSSLRTSKGRCPPRWLREKMSGYPRPATRLRPEEAAVLRVLERQEANERRGTTLARQLRGSLRLVRGGKGRRSRPRRSW